MWVIALLLVLAVFSAVTVVLSAPWRELRAHRPITRGDAAQAARACVTRGVWGSIALLVVSAPLTGSGVPGWASVTAFTLTGIAAGATAACAATGWAIDPDRVTPTVVIATAWIVLTIAAALALSLPSASQALEEGRPVAGSAVPGIIVTVLGLTAGGLHVTTRLRGRSRAARAADADRRAAYTAYARTLTTQPHRTGKVTH